MKKINKKSDRGFTLVELMIALSILSLILVVSTAVMTQLGRLYTKGVNAANVNNASRNIENDLTSTLEFSGSKPYPCTDITTTCYGTSPPARPNPQTYNGVLVYAYCINNIRYSYTLNRELGDDNGASPAVTTNHVLWRDTMKTSANCAPLDISNPTIPGDIDDTSPMSNGYEMLPGHTRLTRLQVVESPANSGVYTINVSMAFGDSDFVVSDGTGHVVCKGIQGSQYCSITNLSTSATRRVE